ncbi:MAG: type IV pilin-like G/H family protein [Pleurocapsa sp. MO_192.B19]|nr:type IV pilin-like G/H family protein [Pleurocapsa sp. MO_192.B19]
MNNVFTAKLLQNLNNKKDNKGFTLIELLVVVIIIGVLAAVALPNLLSQVGKARESEGKTTVGSVNRAQQAFHFERRTFAPAATDITAANNALGVVVNPRYYGYALTLTDANNALVAANAIDANNDGIRQYGGGISHLNGTYDTSLCQSNDVGGTATATAAGGDAGCDAAATELETASTAPTP